MKVPQIIRSIFDVFPLESYKSKSEGPFSLKGRYIFGSQAPCGSLEEEFTLAVHNVSDILVNQETKIYIPTDPVGLTTCLILCRRHNLLLPREATTDTKSGHALMPLSYLASPSNELPILLETTRNEICHIVSTSDILNLNSCSKSSCLDSMFNDFLDGLNDLWTLVLLLDDPVKNRSASRRLFQRDLELEGSEILSWLIDSKVLVDIQSWSSFASRYPYLFSDSKIAAKAVQTLSFFSSEQRKAIKQVHSSKLSEFENAIPHFLSYLASTEDSENSAILGLKFASFIICVEHFLPCGSQSSVTSTKNFNDALDYSKQVLMQY